MFTSMTGSKQVSVRAGFADCDTYRSGFVSAATGNLDAPQFIPQGSVRVHNTIKLNPQLSHCNRDWDTGCKEIGAGHDGAEAVPPTLYLHFPKVEESPEEMTEEMYADAQTVRDEIAKEGY